MQISCTQMHPVTFLAIVIELVAIGAQSALYLNRLREHTRLWYLVLLVLLLIFNIANGLFPDETYSIPIYVQHIIVNGIGFAIVSYFPFYFYRAFGLKKLRFLAIYGVPLFIVLPYLAFFVVGYSVHGDLTFTHRYGYIIPTCYSFILLILTGKAIWATYRENKNRNRYVEEVAAYIAIIPWAFLAPVVYFQWGQLIETLFTNVGFVAISALLLYRTLNVSRAEQKLLTELELVPINLEAIERNRKLFALSAREVEIVHLICQRLSYKEIADKLFISDRTVSKHVQNIFNKVLVNSRSQLVKKMNDYEDR
ncbi:response regulator transcription factor [Sphingobacterium sp. UDSM-2020]|uniref:response regulator transcription factor n=1 Tax=Sphingobacterium sp. UDSM-2020 TaxID=2795738 RepID=UPI001934B7F2|nr:LuxR C-terminal-related transcriptional regulator [Sphingobacterium sp. UDSM-2020]QQD14405.1 response regulator transcription factor [Sphingobacterium sp. UDSM-2020]